MFALTPTMVVASRKVVHRVEWRRKFAKRAAITYYRESQRLKKPQGQPATIPTIRRTRERIGQQKESNEMERGRGGPG
jgi:hypothetical protein